MYKNEFEKINKLEKAYVLGLFYSDGNVSKNQNHCRIQLNKKDLEILKKIRKIFPFFKLYESENNKYTLYSGYKKLKLDLIKNGCLPAKSFENKNNLHIPNLKTNKLKASFVRGVFDGDGGCTLTKHNTKKTKTQKRVYIYSNSLDFLIEIQLLLLINNIITTIDNPKPKNEGFSKNSIVFKLTICTKSYNNFFNYIYNSKLYMKRKYIKFKKILTYPILIEKDKVNCIHCNSKKTVADGFYTYKNIRKQRYLCKEEKCKKNFFCP